MTNIKISATSKSLTEVSNKYCRVILTEDKPSSHRLVETKDGHLEYRMGWGKKNEVTARTFRTLVRTIVQTAKSHQIEHLAICLELTGYQKLETYGEQWFYQTLGENISLASYEFNKYKTKKKQVLELKEVLVCGLTGKNKTAFQKGLTVAESVNLTRDIANTAGEDMQPSNLAKAAQKAMVGTNAKVRVLDYKTIKKLKMGLLEAVGKGAEDAPKLIIIEYRGAAKQAGTGKISKPLVLLGKGITYDTGGLNIKPTGAMHDMHLDMSGGAAVIGAMRAIAKLKLKKNVIGIIPAAENAVSARSMRAGDIVTSMSGLTVEVMHTDAEGRMVLADGLTYIDKHYDAKAIIDVATLTGASLAALGQQTSAVLTKDIKLQHLLTELGEESGDLVWPLPLWDEYKKDLRSSRADVANIQANFSKFGGCIEGGTFLSFFAPKKTPWAHIDMAPRMESIPSDKLAKGATGEPVRLMVKFVETY